MRSRKFDLVLLFVFWLLFLIPSIRWNFDLNHETVLLNSTMGLDKGLMLHRDVFEPKGVLYPWLQGAIQAIFSLPLGIAVLARLIQYFFAGITVFVAWSILRRVSPQFRLVIPIFWLVGNQFWTSKETSLNRLFWLEPNYLVVLMVVFFMKVIVDSFHQKDFKTRRWEILLSAFIIGAIPWVRIQGLLLSLIFVSILIEVCRKNKISLRTPIFTIMLTLAFPYIFLVVNQASDQWFRQILLHPFKYSLKGSKHSTMSIGALGTTITTFIISSFFIILIVFFLGLWQGKFVTRAAILLGIFVVISIHAYANFSEVDKTLDNSLSNWLTIMTEYFPQLIPRFAFVVVAIYFCIRVILFGKRFDIDRNKGNIADILRISSLSSVGCYAYLYPNIGHTFVVSLPALITVAILLTNLLKGNSFLKESAIIQRGLLNLISSLVIYSTALLAVSISDQRAAYTTNALSGVFSVASMQPESASKFEKLLDKLEPKSVIILCDGVLVYNSYGEYMSNSPYFWTGDNIEFVDLMVGNPKYAIICSESSSLKNMDAELATFRLNTKDWRISYTLKLTPTQTATVLERRFG